MRRPSPLLSAIAFAALSVAGASSHAQPKGCAALDPATLGPKTIIGQGPKGEKAASIAELQLTAEEAAKVKAGKFRVGITMQTVNLDWSQLQIQGITDTLKK
jgi:ribose transport system substrate-binding protein